jgi:hypothetical protein
MAKVPYGGNRGGVLEGEEDSTRIDNVVVLGAAGFRDEVLHCRQFWKVAALKA